ncbi:MAG: clostripain-related cysteine peptidase [Bacillota bacterium]
MRKYLAVIMAAAILLFATMLPGFAQSPNDAKKTTVMVYIIGTDLEANYGLATNDINSMINSGVGASDKIKVLVQTGGSVKWWYNDKNPEKNISNSLVQRYLIVNADQENDGIKLLETPGKISMAEARTLQEFIVWGEKNYPADRYILVMWSHGGGCNWGIGTDANYDQAAMGLNAIQQAIKTARASTGKALDIISFDTCLNAEVEIANSLKSEGRFLVASEDVATGWAWKEWLAWLVENPKSTSDAIGECIVSTYIDKREQGLEQSWKDKDKTREKEAATASLIDMSKIVDLNSGIGKMAVKLSGMFKNDAGFLALVKARALAESFGTTEDNSAHDLVDLYGFSANISESQGKEIDGLLNDVILQGEGINRLGYGLSIYCPLRASDEVMTANQEVYKTIGYNDKYVKFTEEFAKKIQNKRKEQIRVYKNSSEQPFVQKEDIAWVRNVDLLLVKDGVFYTTKAGARIDTATGQLSAYGQPRWWTVNGYNVDTPSPSGVNRTTGAEQFSLPLKITHDGETTRGELLVLVSTEYPNGTVLNIKVATQGGISLYEIKPGDSITLIQEQIGADNKVVEVDSGTISISSLDDLKLNVNTPLPAGTYNAIYNITTWLDVQSFELSPVEFVR